MPEICNPACADDQITMYPIGCDRLSQTRKGGSERFILLDCDVTFEDITSTAEWTALQSSQRYIYSPPGEGTLPQPETTKDRITACSPDEVIDEVSGYNWFTKLFDNNNYCDFEFENDVKSSYASKTLLWYGCDGLLYYSRNWTTGTNPGFGGLAVEVYRGSEPKTLQQLFINFKFNTFQNGVTAFAPTQALLDIIFSSSYTTSGGCGI